MIHRALAWMNVCMVCTIHYGLHNCLVWKSVSHCLSIWIMVWILIAVTQYSNIGFADNMICPHCSSWIILYEKYPAERCSKLQLKLNGNYSSLREILAPSLRDHNGSLRAVNFSNWACATLREDEFLRFGAFLLARCRHEADFGLGFLGFSDSLGSLGSFSASRLLGLSGGFSTSRLQSTQFLFCQQCSPWVPPVSVWPWARVQSVQWHGSQSVQWFCLVSRSERA